MSNNVKNDVLLVGAGYMAVEYAKVLSSLNRNFIVVGRGEQSAQNFEQKISGSRVHRGGLDKFLLMNDNLPSYAIVAVNLEQLTPTCTLLLKSGVKNILLEKPGGLQMEDFNLLKKIADEKNASISIAYNRRFYTSTRLAKKYIDEDGGVSSFQFEFTEWLHVFVNMGTLPKILPHLFLANSTHVVDLAFFLGGKPQEITCYKKKISSTCKGHNTIFSGAGISANGALFSYQANWLAPGRWGVEIMTRNRRLIFRPLEKLQVQQMQSTKVDFVDVDYALDTNYKPGLYLETVAFLEHNDDFKDLCSLEEQINNLSIYQKISGNINSSIK